MRQGLTPAHFTAQLEDLRDTSLTLELNLSTFATHRRDGLGWVIWGTMSGKGQSKLKLSGNGNECKPLPCGYTVIRCGPLMSTPPSTIAAPMCPDYQGRT